MNSTARPVGYLRKSRVTSDRDMSWQVQEAKIRELAERHGDGELELLSDWNRSGRFTASRPDYLRLRKMIDAGEVSVLYAYSLSRLSRSLMEYAGLAELCQRKGVKVRLAKEGEQDYSTASGRFTVGILALLAQMEAELAQERARDTITARRARGDYIGSAGYGSRLSNGRLEAHPNQDVAVVVDAFREAGSFSGAAQLLNARNVPTGRGRAWAGNTVARILRRAAPGELAGRRIEPRVRVKGSFTLSRLLVCPCGNVMTPRTTSHTTKYGSYGPYVSYQCFRGRYDPRHPRPYMVSESVVLPWVRGELSHLAPPFDAVEIGDSDDSRYQALEARRLRVIDNYEDGLVDKAERDRKLAAIGVEMESIDVRVRVEAVPAIDWSWPPRTINDALTAVLERIELGKGMRPVRAVWRVPEWRSADSEPPRDGPSRLLA